MQSTLTDRPAMHVIGIETRTSNKMEMSDKGKIPALWKRAGSGELFAAIPKLAEPGTMLAVYSDYENGAEGDYTFLVGVPVTGIEGALPSGMVSRSLPASRVAQLSSEVGPLPGIVIDVWKKIWKMSPTELGAPRAFTYDVERYDARAKDPKHAQVEVTLSVK